MASIALVPIKGVVVSDKSYIPTRRTTSSDEIVQLMGEIKKSRRIKALVLEINSPGGTPLSLRGNHGSNKVC